MGAAGDTTVATLWPRGQAGYARLCVCGAQREQKRSAVATCADHARKDRIRSDYPFIGYDQIIRYTRTGKTASKAAKIRGSSFHSAYLRPPASTKAVRRKHRSHRTVLAGTRTLRAPGPVTCGARRRVAVVRRMFAAVLRRCLCEATNSPLRGSTAQGRCCSNALLHREPLLGTVRGWRAPGGRRRDDGAGPAQGQD